MTTQDPQVPDPASPRPAAGSEEAGVGSPAGATPESTATFDRIGATETEYTYTGPDARDRAAIDALPPNSALLVVQHGPNAGARFLLDAAKVTAGRHTRADIFLDDVTVSRKHAEFLHQDDGYEVRDVGSLNGTYVNRERIDQGLLRGGDEVQIGKFRLTYHPSPNRAAAVAADESDQPGPSAQPSEQ